MPGQIDFLDAIMDDDILPVSGAKPKPNAIKKTGKQILLWLEPRDLKKLENLCSQLKLNRSDTLRHLIRSI